VTVGRSTDTRAPSSCGSLSSSSSSPPRSWVDVAAGRRMTSVLGEPVGSGWSLLRPAGRWKRLTWTRTPLLFDREHERLIGAAGSGSARVAGGAGRGEKRSASVVGQASQRSGTRAAHVDASRFERRACSAARLGREIDGGVDVESGLVGRGAAVAASRGGGARARRTRAPRRRWCAWRRDG